MDPELPPVFSRRYAFHNGPDAHPDNLEEGCNCQTAVHDELRTHKIFLPKYYLSREIWYDPDDLFRQVTEVEAYEPGDIFLFGPHGLTDARMLHLAVVVDTTETGEPVLRHASFSERGTSDWPLSKFFDPASTGPYHHYYETLYGVRRHVDLDKSGLDGWGQMG